MLNYRNAMQGTIKTVRQIITSWGRGHIFFTDDFSMLESQGSVRIALSQLSAEGFIVRLARGIYCYPEIVGKHFSKTIVPDEEMIALALAAKERIRLIPYGDQAAYKLGITTLRVSDLNYLTDGPPRKIKVLKGRTIFFNHTSEVKIFDYRNETMQSVCSAIRALGYDRIGEREKRIIRNKLRAVSEQDFARDLMIAPAWVQEIVRELWKN